MPRGFGLVVVHAGLTWWWTPLFSGLIFGGSLELLLVAMVVAAAPLAAVALTSGRTQFCDGRITVMSVAAKSSPVHSTGCPVRSASA